MADVFANAGIEAARIVGESPEMDRVANAIATRGRARALARGDLAFATSIRVVRVRGRRGVTDRVIEATDPLAAPKELGHVIRNEADGPVLGFVPGLRYLGGAVRAMPEVRGD